MNLRSPAWKRFRANRRGWWSLWIFVALYAASLCAGLFCCSPHEVFPASVLDPHLRPAVVSAGHYPVAAAEYSPADLAPDGNLTQSPQRPPSPEEETASRTLRTSRGENGYPSFAQVRAWGDTNTFSSALSSPLPASVAEAAAARLRGEPAPAFEFATNGVSYRLAAVTRSDGQTVKRSNGRTVRVYLRRADWRTAKPEQEPAPSLRGLPPEAGGGVVRHSSLVTRHSAGPSGTAPAVPLEPAVFPFRPIPGHPFGFDAAGRDVFSRVVYGARTAITFGLLLTLASLALGVAFGAVQGYFVRWVDIAGQRFTEIWSAIPFLYVMIFLGNAFGRSFGLLLACYAIFNWIGVASYVRAEFLRLRTRPFVDAARVQGLSHARIMFRHVLPNALTPLITLFPFLLVGAIGSLAALDYLGFGLPDGAPSWGELLQQAQAFRHAWWLVLWPSLALFLVMLLGVFVGEALRDAFDPRPVSALDREVRDAERREPRVKRQDGDDPRSSAKDSSLLPTVAPAVAASASEAAPFPSTQVLDRGDGEAALRIEDLRVSFDTSLGELRAVDGVSLSLAPGETLGLVGESGCGKSVTAMSILRLVPSPPGRLVSGRILFDGRDLATLPLRELRKIRGAAVGMVFQDPMTALSPLHRIGDQLLEALRLHRPVSRKEGLALAAEWLARCGIPDPERCLREYPFRLSGGMQQRVMIASVLMTRPRLVIADEPTTALDVTVQAQVLDLMRSARDRETALLLITHNMAVVRRTCSRVAVMYAGRIVESGPVEEVFAHPRHPYTAALLAAMPSRHAPGERLPAIPGTLPSPLALPPGCRFAPRCNRANAECRMHNAECTMPVAGGESRSGEPPRLGEDASPHREPHVWDCLHPLPDLAPEKILTQSPQRPQSPIENSASRTLRTSRGEEGCDVAPVLAARSLVKAFPRVTAVSEVSLELRAGETLAVVGESGSGKTTLARMLAGLEVPTAGEILLDGAPLPFHRTFAQRRALQVVFQDPYSSLNPRHSIADLLTEGPVAHGLLARRDRAAFAREWLERVGLPPEAAGRYPHEFSGGQLQRVSIARALALRPRVLLCDEPVSALDVSVQAQILNLLADLKAQYGPAVLFITHDLGVVRSVADRILVLHRGRAVEEGPAARILSEPRDPYTRELLAAEPRC